jgi:hypothetical protein
MGKPKRMILEGTMKWHVLKDREKILRIMNHLITKKTEIKVRIRGEKAPFTSKLIKIEKTEVLSESFVNTTEVALIIEKLHPAKGDSLIQSFPNVIMEFKVYDYLCQCSVQNIGVSNIPPYYGFIMSFPDALEIREKRKEPRIVYEKLEMVSVEFRLPMGGEKDRSYTLNVLDRSKGGLGLLVTQKDFNLLKVLNPGDKLQNMTLYSESLMMRIDAIVKHKTRIEEGNYKGCHILGIELREGSKD